MYKYGDMHAMLSPFFDEMIYLTEAEELRLTFKNCKEKQMHIGKCIYIVYTIGECEVLIMAKSVNMSVRVDPELKEQAEIILDQLGMNMNGTINMFLNQIVREKRVPLNLSLNTEQSILSDIRLSRLERENGIEGVEARDLLEELKRIVAETETKEVITDSAVVD